MVTVCRLINRFHSIRGKSCANGHTTRNPTNWRIYTDKMAVYCQFIMT